MCELKSASDYDPDYKKWSKMPMPFVPSKFEVKIKDSVKKQFHIVSDLFNKSSLIINATDFDREGEVIFAYAYEASGSRATYKRAHFSSQTKEGLEDGFKTLLTSAQVQAITDAGRGRGIADAIIGWNITAKMSLLSSSHSVLRVGRFLAPT